jgi:CRISPR-associated endonuclease/helicase Cas3
VPFYAHKDERRFYLLSAHLAGVAAGAAERVAAVPGRGELFPAALVAGLAHDFGKYTGYFQEYLRTGRGGPEKQHAFLSGLWAAYLAGRLALPPEQQLALFLAVARHHQELTDPEEYLVAPRELAGDWAELEPTVQERLRVVAAQVANLQSQAGAVAASLGAAARRTARLLAGRGLAVPAWLLNDWGPLLTAFLEDWRAAFGSLYGIYRRQKRAAGAALGTYFDLLLLFSGLIDADKIHAARVAEAGRAALPGDVVDRYRAARFGSPRTAMENLRENLYRSAVARAAQAPLEQRLFTLTAPTGAGKTLAGLAAAYRLRERLAGACGVAPRLIYALPFTSIVDQTFAVAEAILRTALPEPSTALPSTWLLKHHHLAAPVYRGSGREELSLDEALLLTESWQSEMVVTTFVQFFHTLVGYQNRMLKKFHRLGGAVVILDEVQSIPVEYWPLVEETLRQACAHLGMRVILMTATRPEWFGSGEALELAGDPETVRRQFAAVNRVTLTAEITPCPVAEAAAAFLEQYQPEHSYLVVLNTIKSSIAFFRLLREAWGAQCPPLYYLSTNIVPAERERRLSEIRGRLARGEKPVLVSTQVVEAGVDLDFDEVWRDLGPVDAVVQAAGRCNRHFSRARGRVRLFQLVDEKTNRPLASFVYGKTHTWVAGRLFAERPVLAEPDFFDAVADYFCKVREAKSAAESEKILQAMAALRFDRRGEATGEPAAVSDFALIRDLPRYVDVFVCADATAEAVWARYQATVAREADPWRRREAFLSIRRDFRRYLISVPGELLLDRLAAETRPLVIPAYLLDEFYDPETGFKRVDEENALIF